MKTYQKQDAVVQKYLPSFDEQGLTNHPRELVFLANLGMFSI
jgi:hypothetical protein